jgi:hypothetical protein
LGYKGTTLFLGDVNTGTCPPGWGSLESETVVMTPVGLGFENDCAVVNDRPILLSERMLQQDYNRKSSVIKILLIMSLKGLVAKTN